MRERDGTRHANKVFAVLNEPSAAAQSALAASWSRSMQYGLDPESSPVSLRLTEAEIRDAQMEIESIVREAQSPMDRLFNAVGDSGCCVLLTNRAGLAIDRRGVAADDSHFSELGVWTGNRWDEISEGTNGVGTCIVENRHLTIQGDQHFLTRNTGLTCSVAPIWNELGDLVATLDVATCRSDLSPSVLKLTVSATLSAAGRIENNIFRRAFQKCRIVIPGDNGRGVAGMLAVNKDDVVIGANRAARSALGLTSTALERGYPTLDLLQPDLEWEDSLETAERAVIKRSLARTKGNVSEAARQLGISRATIVRKIARHGLGRLSALTT